MNLVLNQNVLFTQRALASKVSLLLIVSTVAQGHDKPNHIHSSAVAGRSACERTEAFTFNYMITEASQSGGNWTQTDTLQATFIVGWVYFWKIHQEIFCPM